LEDDEYLKKVYKESALIKKNKELLEYYKYHAEIPRVYMLPISLICNCNLIKLDYHDRKRRINYYKIKVLLH
jgi:hypothetical protein